MNFQDNSNCEVTVEILIDCITLTIICVAFRHNVFETLGTFNGASVVTDGRGIHRKEVGCSWAAHLLQLVPRLWPLKHNKMPIPSHVGCLDIVVILNYRWPDKVALESQIIYLLTTSAIPPIPLFFRSSQTEAGTQTHSVSA